MRPRVPAFAVAALLITAPAFAAFHFIHVKEVFAGSQAHPTAQYVLLQAYDGGQNFVAGHSVLTFNSAGAPTGTFTFPAGPPLGNGANQMTIFVATPDAATIFNITADLAMTAVLDPAGGKVCWDGSTPQSCFVWGDYTGTDVGTPYNASAGLIPAYAARRRLDICGQAGTLDACDDTDDSANDWITVTPHPIKNNLDEGQTPPATCGNNTLEGLEGCDDGDTDDGDGCSAVCKLEPVDLLPGPLLVDVTALAPPDSNVNGVFEPGETVQIEPSWTYTGLPDVELTGQLTNFTGVTTASPPFPFYLLSDGAANYGTLVATDSSSCVAGPDCYRISAEALNRPAQHWDATADEIVDATPTAVGESPLGDPPLSGVQTWTLHLGNSFPDVPTSHIFYAFIENLFHNSVTGGCAGGNYCPGDPVTRAQMAVFLLKASLGSDYVPTACTGAVFGDVPCTGGIFDPWIEDLANRGITGGCGGGNYCPGNTVTRGQMAVFLLKSLEGSAYDPPDCAGVFDDVACTPGTGFSDWIEELFARQITGGCSVSPPLYCPNNPNNRGQMAVFLVKTFSLLLYGFPVPLL